MTGPAKGKEFSFTLATMRSGAADQAGSALLQKLVEAIEGSDDEKAKGAVILRLTIAKLPDGDGELTVNAEFKIALPSVKIKPAVMYADEDFNLIKSNPKQLSMLNEGNDRGSRIQPHSEEALARVGRGDGSGTVIDITPNHSRPAI